MKRSQFLPRAAAATALPLLASCSDGAPRRPTSTSSSVDGEIEPRPISWLLSRPANGAVIEVMTQIADEYAQKHPGFSLRLITTPDRPSYLQKYVTLAAAGKRPELFDTDATPFAQKLADGYQMIDIEDLLRSLDMLDELTPAALGYQTLPDGTLPLMPPAVGLERCR